MKLYKAFLHFLITLVSMFAFLMGWATLAHSLKPTQPTSQQQQALAPLAPLPPVGVASNSSSSGGIQIFSPSSQPRARSMFVTRGS
jgi:energy-converting hydrogenase Eha subunit F